ncbi:hypothetical protein Ab1vBOLIVR5_gp75c [Agrobacterium phage OLIVR5]|uniref:Uncharacterized protein n=2 Tax=Caudoviricetes TaxID=2731619 RepID=A0A858MT70_9CAUD|nr:hypothetical protein KNU99_gp075 [Agrobacterium phage OLIVR5]QIW87723.1 hypothetical protein Ab1vBOLIVR5_gp75c [Agrobacterium phage OLIVR5]QIW87985.1 hypothetical protein Ab1vBOLIVR6_gp78c [Agrobacterium phage OLIVR6]
MSEFPKTPSEFLAYYLRHGSLRTATILELAKDRGFKSEDVRNEIQNGFCKGKYSLDENLKVTLERWIDV